MLTQKQIFNLYQKYNVKASKRFGQNFLHNENIISKIVEKAEIENKDVIEIGPGLGSLTLSLLPKVKSLSSYEIDEDMKRVIEGEIDDPKFKLIFKDFLDEEFSWTGKRDVVANIPYNITSPILFKLFENSAKFNSATLMIQKEVGERLLAKPKQSSYGKLTVTTNYFADVEKVVDVPKESFIPAPKVESIVVKLSFKNKPYDKKFLDFIKEAFSQQRKKLTNNLKNKVSKEKLLTALEELGVKDTIRPQEISLNQYIEIYNKL